MTWHPLFTDWTDFTDLTDLALPDGSDVASGAEPGLAARDDKSIIFSDIHVLRSTQNGGGGLGEGESVFSISVRGICNLQPENCNFFYIFI